MHDKTRTTLPLVGAIALTASALLAGSGSALAGKTDPSFDLLESFSGCSPTGEMTYYEARVSLDTNKGRWVYVSAELEVDGTIVDHVPWGKHNKNVDVELTKFMRGTPSIATVSIELGDRKGPSVKEKLTICG